MKNRVKIPGSRIVLNQNTAETAAYNEEAEETQQKLRNITAEYQFSGMGTRSYYEVKEEVSLIN